MADLVALVGHLAWPLTVLALCFLAKDQLKQIVQALAKRIADRRSHVQIGKTGIEIKSSLEAAYPKLKKIEPIQPDDSIEEKTEIKALPVAQDSVEPKVRTLAKQRAAIYEESRGLCLAHILEPTTTPNQEFDVAIFLLPHKGADISAVAKAEFFFGRHWGNRIFEGIDLGDVIGVRTSAHGPFLCLCQVTFKDGKCATLSRYIDFEMGKLVEKLTDSIVDRIVRDRRS